MISYSVVMSSDSAANSIASVIILIARVYHDIIVVVIDVNKLKNYSLARRRQA